MTPYNITVSAGIIRSMSSNEDADVTAECVRILSLAVSRPPHDINSSHLIQQQSLALVNEEICPTCASCQPVHSSMVNGISLDYWKAYWPVSYLS